MITNEYLDDISEEYINHREGIEGVSPEFISKVKQWAAQQAQPQVPQQAQPEVEPEEKEDRGFFGDIGGGLVSTPKQIVGGMVDAYNESIGKIVDGAWDWMADNWEVVNSLHEGTPDLLLPTTDKSDSVTGNIIRSTAQFLTGFIPALKGAKAIGITGKVLAPMVAGAVTDVSVFNPLEGRLSDFLNEVPVLKSVVPDYLTTDINDSEAEGRFKNALEGLALGGITEGVFHALRGFKALKSVDGVKSTKPLNEQKRAEPFKEAEVDVERVANIEADKPEFAVRPKAETAKELSEKLLKGEKVDLEEHFDDFNFNYIEDDGTLQEIYQKVSTHYKDVFEKAKGGENGVRTHEVVKEIAELTGTSINQINNMFYETKHLDSDFYAARDLLVASAKKVKSLVDAVNSGDDSSAALINLKKQVVRHAGLQAQVKSIQTNVARTLNAMKIPADGNISNEALEMILDSNGGRKVIKKFAEKFNTMSDPAQMNRFVRDSVSAKTLDGVFYYWINAILSGPSTHIVNITSNSIATVVDLVETGIAASKNFITGSGEVTYTEALAKLNGMLHGFRDAFRISGEALRASGQSLLHGDFSGAKAVLKTSEKDFGTVWRAGVKDTAILDPMTKFEHSYKPISGEAFGWTGTSGKIADILGMVIGLPGRALITADELFKAVNYRSELYGLATREALRRGHEGDVLKAFVKDYIDNPPKSLHTQALDKARLTTFQNELGSKGQAFQKFLSKATPLKFVVPFVRTPTNIIKYIGHRTPILNRFSEAMKADLAAGGARAELARARTALGASLYATGTLLAANGLITGGSDKSTAESNQLINRQSYSVKLGDQWVSFSRLDPFGAFFGLCADLVELAPQVGTEDYEELATACVTALSRNVVSKTYLTGITDIINAISDPERYGSRWYQGFVSSFIPNFLNQINRAEWDNQIKEIHSLRDSLMRRLPYYSKGVFPKRHVITGEPVLYGEGISAGISPFYAATESQEPSLQEMNRLQMRIGGLPDSIKDVDLTPEQYDRYQELVTQIKNPQGLNLLEHLNEIVKDARYIDLPDGTDEFEGGKEKALRKIINQYRQQGMITMLREDKKLFENVLQNQRMKEFYKKG